MDRLRRVVWIGQHPVDNSGDLYRFEATIDTIGLGGGRWDAVRDDGLDVIDHAVEISSDHVDGSRGRVDVNECGEKNY